jgi:lipoate-protein ligase A
VGQVGRRPSVAPPDTKWRVLRDPAGAGAWNMAMDVALARTLRDREGVLRVYEWSRPTLSFGRNQPARERFEHLPFDRIGDRGVDVVRRPTGGREVVHERELTYSVVAPASAGLSPRDLYRTITEAIAEALRSLGVPAHVTPTQDRVPGLGAGPCFAAPGAGEIEVEGKKIVGSAQVRVGGALLQHGSIPLLPPVTSLPGIRFAGVTLADLLAPESPKTAFDRVAIALEEAVAAALPGAWRAGQLRREESEVAAALLPYYESPSWTWRR